MAGFGSFVLRALRWRRKAPARTAAVQESARKEVVICVGCHEDAAILDAVLAPGEYQISFLRSIEGAYTHIASAMPDRVILCMRADDEGSLQVLSMLSLDPRTNGIPVITCVPEVVGGDEGLESEGTRELAMARPGFVVLH